MKRSLLTVVVMGLVVGAALAAEVRSVNAVGYMQLDVPAGKKVIAAVNFLEEGTGDCMLLADLIGDQLTGGNSFLNGDNIVVWDNEGKAYTTYFKFIDGTWRNKDTFALATNEVCNGDAFWIVNRQAVSQGVTFDGEVVDLDGGTNVMDLFVGPNLIGYPFSAEVDVADTALGASAVKGNSFLNADNIVVWDPVSGSYTTYFYFIDDTWRNKDTFALLTGPIPYATGVWYIRRTSQGEWREPQPYNLDD